MSYNEFLPKPVAKYQMHGNSFYVPTKSVTVTELTLMELKLVLTKFNKNMTNSLVADTGPQADRGMQSPHIAF